MSRIVYLSVGWICAALGTVGACVPLLPTVSLYLLAALCFAKGSRRVHAWFVSTKLYQDNLKSYAEGEGMTMKTKARIMLTITVQMAIGYAFMRHVPMGQIILACVWAGLMIYFSFVVKTRSVKDFALARQKVPFRGVLLLLASRQLVRARGIFSRHCPSRRDCKRLPGTSKSIRPKCLLSC